MTQEEKQILLKDLSARLLYGVKCNALLKQIDGSLKSVFGTFKGYNGWATVGNNLVDIETVRPYLRPMSSMTHDEDVEYMDVLKDGHYGRPSQKCASVVDWLNAHQFDYRGLIPMGLALEAEEGMYK